MQVVPLSVPSNLNEWHRKIARQFTTIQQKTLLVSIVILGAVLLGMALAQPSSALSALHVRVIIGVVSIFLLTIINVVKTRYIETNVFAPLYAQSQPNAAVSRALCTQRTEQINDLNGSHDCKFLLNTFFICVILLSFALIPKVLPRYITSGALLSAFLITELTLFHYTISKTMKFRETLIAICTHS